jgi:hypothetical protein
LEVAVGLLDADVGLRSADVGPAEVADVGTTAASAAGIGNFALLLVEFVPAAESVFVAPVLELVEEIANAVVTPQSQVQLQMVGVVVLVVEQQLHESKFALFPMDIQLVIVVY